MFYVPEKSPSRRCRARYAVSRRHWIWANRTPQRLLQLQRRRTALGISNRFTVLDLRGKVKNMHLERQLSHVHSILDNVDNLHKQHPKGVPAELRAAAKLVTNRFRFWIYCEGSANYPRVFDDWIVTNLQCIPPQQKYPIIMQMMETVARSRPSQSYASQLQMGWD